MEFLRPNQSERLGSVSVEPLKDAWIEIIQLLEVEGMARVIVEMGIAIRNGVGHFFSHPKRSENVVFAANDQAGLTYVAELIVDIMVDASSSLSFESVQRLRRGAMGESVATFYQASMGFVGVPKGFGEYEQLYPFHELGRRQVREAGLHVLEDGGSVAVAAGPGTHEHGAFDFFWMT